MLDQFSPWYKAKVVGVIYWGSGGTGAEFGSAMSHAFFPKDVMDDIAYIGAEMNVLPLSAYRKLIDLAVEAS